VSRRDLLGDCGNTWGLDRPATASKVQKPRRTRQFLHILPTARMAAMIASGTRSDLQARRALAGNPTRANVYRLS
jgi:hypothetical protein